MTRQGLPALLALPVLLAALIYLFYPGHSGTSLTYDVVYLLIPLTSLLVSLAAGEQLSWRRRWYAWSLLAWGTGQLLHPLARHLGWGHPVLFAVIYYCSAAVLVTATGITAASWVKAARARYRKARA